MARSRETKIELTAYDDLFQTDESREEAKLSKIRDIPISEIDEFPDHPFKVLMDEDMEQLVESIKEAFIKIAAYFNNSVVPTQGKMLMIEAGDTVLVVSQTLLNADDKKDSEYSMDRRATYVYRKINGKWLCAVDNSYGTTLLD